ncbi:B3 domain-containing protein REM19 [Linum perenne]
MEQNGKSVWLEAGRGYEIDYSNTKVNVKVESECDVTSNEAVQRLSISSPKATTKPSLKPHEQRRKNVKGRTASVEKLDGSGKQGNTSRATESDSTCRLNKHGHSPKTRDKPLLGSSQPHKLRRTNGMEGTASSSKGQNRSRTSSKPTEEASPLARAKAVFKSENPFFMENFTNQCGDIILQLPNDVRVWTVKYLVRGCGNLKLAVFQTNSWNSFANDNSMRLGDVCVFELVKCGIEPSFNVTIFRASHDRKSQGNTGDQRKKPLTVAMEAANAFTSNHPFFKIAVTHSNLKRCQVLILVSFQKHMKKGTRKMELRIGSQVWVVWVNRYEADEEKRRLERVFINGGWKEFTEGNSLIPGDVCVFELMKGEQEDDVDVAGLLIPVPFRKHMKKGTRKMELWIGSQVWVVWVNRYEADEEKRRLERVFINGGWKEFTEGNSLIPGDVCVFELMKSEQEDDVDVDVADLLIPVPFRKHMKKGTRKMELWIGSQVWVVWVNRYEADEEKRRLERVFINGGWKEFTEGNSLIPGDVCVFELMKGEQEDDVDVDVADLLIPVPFRKHMKKGTRKMELWIGSQVWVVWVNRYEADEEKRRLERVFINGGWKEFTEGNSLIPGDVCVFELMKGEQEDDVDVDVADLVTTVARVHVFRG